VPHQSESGSPHFSNLYVASRLITPDQNDFEGSNLVHWLCIESAITIRGEKSPSRSADLVKPRYEMFRYDWRQFFKLGVNLDVTKYHIPTEQWHSQNVDGLGHKAA